jgi:ribosome biogenesis GTPase|tara:strand:+ start:988 stop:1407 length:420 start_codon:yes stop_codon:yes gene_type:complete
VTDYLSLANLGWLPFFQQQLSLEELDTVTPARIIEQHKSVVEVGTAVGKLSLAVRNSMPPLTVGDWVLLDGDGQFFRALERKSCFKRKAPGTHIAEQLIAANVDTAFIVCSLNEDFNLNRIERFLSIANEGRGTGCGAE